MIIIQHPRCICRYLPHDNPDFKFSTVTSSTVCALLSPLDGKKSVGPASAKFLKEVVGVVAEPLSKLFNRSLRSGVFPDG